MHKITTLLAALALTACSVHVDSQYGLRLESRRVLAPQSEPLEHSAPAEVPTEVTPLAFDLRTEEYPAAQQVPYSLNPQVEQGESLSEVQNQAAPQTIANQASTIAEDKQEPQSEVKPSQLEKWVKVGLKVIATLFLAFATLIAALYGILILAITDWTSTVGSPGDFIGPGTYGYPSGIFLTLLSAGGVWLGISLIKEVWRKNSEDK